MDFTRDDEIEDILINSDHEEESIDSIDDLEMVDGDSSVTLRCVCTRVSWITTRKNMINFMSFTFVLIYL